MVRVVNAIQFNSIVTNLKPNKNYIMIKLYIANHILFQKAKWLPCSCPALTLIYALRVFPTFCS